MCLLYLFGETQGLPTKMFFFLHLQIDAHIDTLVSEQASFILNRAGLAHAYGIVQQHQPNQVGVHARVNEQPSSLFCLFSLSSENACIFHMHDSVNGCRFVNGNNRIDVQTCSQKCGQE